MLRRARLARVHFAVTAGFRPSQIVIEQPDSHRQPSQEALGGAVDPDRNGLSPAASRCLL